MRLKVDIIVSGGPTVTRPTKEATATLPIIMALDDDPVGSGFVVSLARPGRNITGLSALSPEISGKQLEVLKDTVPKLSRVAVIGNSTRAGNVQMLRETERAGESLKIQLQSLEVRDPKEIVTAFGKASKGRAEASPRAEKSRLPFSPTTDRRTRGKESASGNLSLAGER